MDAWILEIENLQFSYGKTVILDQLFFNVSPGTIVGIVGANGSGKTTLIRLIAGVLRPNAGSIKLFGENPSSKPWEKIGYMPQMQALYPDLTIEQNLSFFPVCLACPIALNVTK